MKETKPNTKVTGKEFSPLIIRRYSRPILAFVAIITDDNLDSLDNTVNSFFKEQKGMPNSIQGMRNMAGALSERIGEVYEKCEGIAVIFQADKMTISSLDGDFMNHESCRIELYGLLNFATQV